jgi:hypothetical protein
MDRRTGGQQEGSAMAIDFSRHRSVPMMTRGEFPMQECRNFVHAKPKARQSCAIRELSNALAAAGFATLDKQARVLGLCRSTTWTILKGSHKSSGLSATIINRALAAPHLPALVRAKILEYVGQKAAGRYGHSKTQRRKFIAQLSIEEAEKARLRANLLLPALRRQLSITKSSAE